MNYLEIIIQGYFNDNNREYLKNYFVREYKIANRQFYEADEFFSGCQKILENWEKDIKRELYERKKELYFMLNGAKNKTLSYSKDDDRELSLEEKYNQTIQHCEEELNEISENNFYANLFSLTNGRIAYSMSYNEVLFIKRVINKAFLEVSSPDNLHFETFPEFLDYLKIEVKDLDFDDRHSEAKRILEQQKVKLENSSFQSEIDEVKEFSENAVKDFKHKLMLSFTNENYKTKVNGGLNPDIIAVGKLYFQYENLYNNAKNKSDVFNYLSSLSKEQTERKYIAKEYALAYIFDLYAKGEMIPINAIDGGYNAKQLKQIGLDKGFSSPDTFYRAVKTVLKFDLNKVKDLQRISKDWLHAVEKLSNNWIETQQYLRKQNLIEE